MIQFNSVFINVMKFCPDCRTEYTDEARVCADCSAMLIGTLPAPDPMDTCDVCGGDMGLDSDYCPRCGTLYAADQYSCTRHPLHISTGVCIVCQQLFCDECLTRKGVYHLCPDHALVEISEGWALVHTSPDYMEAEIVRGKLESHGITTNPRNTGNIATLADGFIDNALGRTIFKYPLKIFVPVEQYFDAMEVIAHREPEEGNGDA
ncbi:MAG: hypothetical protein F9K22_02260 [Bacteroidetes bacterium]|nr:MAG: hypothetical protein F9K22_02260 [Bacteroidota bacterium]